MTDEEFWSFIELLGGAANQRTAPGYPYQLVEDGGAFPGRPVSVGGGGEAAGRVHGGLAAVAGEVDGGGAAAREGRLLTWLG